MTPNLWAGGAERHWAEARLPSPASRSLFRPAAQASSAVFLECLLLCVLQPTIVIQAVMPSASQVSLLPVRTHSVFAATHPCHHLTSSLIWLNARYTFLKPQNTVLGTFPCCSQPPMLYSSAHLTKVVLKIRVPATAYSYSLLLPNLVQPDAP